MHQAMAWSVVMIGASMVACGGKEKYREPRMQPAAGDSTEQRQQTEPSYGEQQQPSQSDMEQSGTEWQQGSQREPAGEQPAITDPYGAPMAPGAEPQAGAKSGNSDARMLAETRCRRALRCDQIGAGRAHPSVEECEASFYTEGEQALMSCAAGLNRDALTTCITAIQSEGCDSPMNSLTDYEECRSALLCAR